MCNDEIVPLDRRLLLHVLSSCLCTFRAQNVPALFLTGDTLNHGKGGRRIKERPEEPQ